MMRKQKYILLVDDEVNARVVFSDVLRGEGYRVKEVKDGYEAIKAIERESFDLALVDLRMPKMSGIEVLENIKKKKPQVPVIIYSGYITPSTAVEAMRKGAFDYISKLSSLEELKLSIKRALTKK